MRKIESSSERTALEDAPILPALLPYPVLLYLSFAIDRSAPIIDGPPAMSTAGSVSAVRRDRALIERPRILDFLNRFSAHIFMAVEYTLRSFLSIVYEHLSFRDFCPAVVRIHLYVLTH